MFVVTFTILFLSLFAVVVSTSIDNNLNSVYATANKTLSVITSVSPITNIVKNIAGDKISLTGLVPEGVNSHTFEPVPSDIIKLNNADLVIINGLFLEDNMEKVVNESLKNKPDIQLLKLADNTINSTGWIFDFSFPKELGHPNPHLWLNPVNAMKFANLTKDKLIEMDPNNTDYYTENAEKYIALLKQLDEGIEAAVQTISPENRKLITYHDSWAYFAPRYNITVIGAVQPSDFSEPSPLDIAKLIDQIKAEKIPAIFASEVFSNRITDQIAKEAGINIVQTLRDDSLPGNLTSPNHTYVGMMLDNMEHMIIPLGGNTSSLTDINPENTYTSP
ncbi:MAG: zinc ABC transporter substrate-binding protein [Nitrosopumilus sp.]|nr:zinc ABC transporter substrate-binding protein [Nitrosopumilus sp.]